LQWQQPGDEVGLVVDDAAGCADVEVGIGAPAGSVGMIMMGNEFALVLVKESVEVIGRRDLKLFESGRCESRDKGRERAALP
jgi:hypothetical protein